MCLTGAVQLAVTADNVIDVYHDGRVVLNNGDWTQSSVINLENPCVLAFEAYDAGVNEGILASTSTGVVTDETWRCTTVLEPDWHTFAFDDSAWPQARVVGAHGVSPWGNFPDISTDAKWIWAQGSTGGTVYCRKKLCVGKKELPSCQ